MKDTIDNKVDFAIKLMNELRDRLDLNKFEKAIDKFMISIIESIKWSGELESIIRKLKRKRKNTLEKIAKLLKVEKIYIEYLGYRYAIALSLLKDINNKKLLNELLDQKKTVKKVEIDRKKALEKLLAMNEEGIRKELSKMKVAELRALGKGLIHSNYLRKRKKELIEALIEKIIQLKHIYRMGPA